MSLRCAPSRGCAPARGVAAPQWGGRIPTFGAAEIFGSCTATPVASGRGKKVGPPETRMLKQYVQVNLSEILSWYGGFGTNSWMCGINYNLISVPLETRCDRVKIICVDFNAL